MNHLVAPPTALWGIEAPIEPLSGGHRNLVFRTVGLTQDWVFKSTRRSPEAIAWLHQVHEAARLAGFAVPGFRKSLQGHLIEAGWTCEAFIVGTPVSPTEIGDFGARLVAFHSGTRDLPQRPRFLSSRALLTASAGGDVDLDQMPSDLVAICRDAWRAVQGADNVVVHGDLNRSNVLRTETGQVALIDWDETRKDLPLFDLNQIAAPSHDAACAALAWEVACSWSIEPSHARAAAERLRRAMG